MILGLQKDPNFKFEKDWEFFTNMFKKQVQKRVLDNEGRIDDQSLISSTKRMFSNQYSGPELGNS